jgi:hypothetical protein
VDDNLISNCKTIEVAETHSNFECKVDYNPSVCFCVLPLWMKAGSPG